MGVDAIAEAVVGMSAGDNKEVKADFPKDFELEVLAGKQVIYQLEVHEVREKKLPIWEDVEFLKSLKIESVDELKQKYLSKSKCGKSRKTKT